MHTHVTTTVSACFADLHRLHSVRHSLSRPALLSLVRALVVSKIDYSLSVNTVLTKCVYTHFITIVMPSVQVSCIGGTKYPHCIVS